MANDKALRAQLVKLLDYEEAHVGFDKAVKGIPPRLRGKLPELAEHTLWQLVEHLRIAQADILEFCLTAKYKEKKWPDDYWPKALGPHSDAAWTKSIAAYRRDRKAMQKLAANPEDRSVRDDPARHRPDLSARDPAHRRSQRVSHRPDRRRCGDASASGRNARRAEALAACAKAAK